MPDWSGVQPQAFIAGFGIVELTAATLFAFLVSVHMVKKLIAAAGL